MYCDCFALPLPPSTSFWPGYTTRGYSSFLTVIGERRGEKEIRHMRKEGAYTKKEEKKRGKKESKGGNEVKGGRN